MINGHNFRQGNQKWCTPLDLADDVRDLWGGIGLDPCTEPRNHLRAECFYTEADDGLILPWADRTWCNPPYSQLHQWLDKLEHEARYGFRIALYLSVARTETDRLQALIAQASCVQFLKGKQRHSEGAEAFLANVIYWFNQDPAAIQQSPMGRRGVLLQPY